MQYTVADIECNRCHGTYQNTERDTLSVLYNHCFLSICPKCTDEVATLMGLSKKDLLSKYGMIKEAETENNRLRRISDGTVCKKCENKFAEGEPRIRKSSSSNVESWHINCYDKNIA